MVQLSPDTRTEDWSACSGYQYTDTLLYGFSHTHMSGTGGADLGDILFLPLTGNFDATWLKEKKQMRMLKDGETATAGYYSVKLGNGVLSELTATPHCGVHRYTYPAGERSLLVDLTHYLKKEHIHQLELKQISDTEIQGMRFSSGWVSNQYIYFIARFSAPIRKINGWCDGKLTYEKDLKGTDIRAILEFENGNAPVEVSVGISATGYEGARKNIEAEMPSPKFDKALMQAVASWDTEMGRIDISGATDDEKTIFYTALYHTMICPNLFSDVDYKYRGMDGKLHEGKSPHYATFSLWDTYRAAHPLYTILIPKRVPGMINSLLDYQKVQGHLPVWTLWDKETYCMIANHAVPVVVDAYLKGFKGFSPEDAYNAIKASLTVSHKKSDWETYDKYGYYPFDITTVESVSRTLESAYDDYCAAQMAKAMGKDKDYEFFMKRASAYKSLFDPGTKLMRGKDSKGKWRFPFNPFLLSHAASCGGDYTEGNAWQYTWHVQHDVAGLIDLMGGKESFAMKLDSLFMLDTIAENTGFVSDVSGFIGQYAHGNEPSHHVVYLYNYVDQPWKTQELIPEIFERFYKPKPDGLCGNDDCGQMSAWYIFSSMGFYPVDPISGEYVLGAPQMDKISIQLTEDRAFVVEAKNLSRKNKYVKSVELNGKPVRGLTIKHEDIMSGGHLVFTMTDEPVKRVLK